jgi:hypothetical protein
MEIEAFDVLKKKSRTINVDATKSLDEPFLMSPEKTDL